MHFDKLSTEEVVLYFKDVLHSQLGPEWNDAKTIGLSSQEIKHEINVKETELCELLGRDVHEWLDYQRDEYNKRHPYITEGQRGYNEKRAIYNNHLDRLNKWRPASEAGKIVKVETIKKLTSALDAISDNFPYYDNPYDSVVAEEAFERECERLKHQIENLHHQYPLVLKLEVAIQPYYDSLEVDIESL